MEDEGIKIVRMTENFYGVQEVIGRCYYFYANDELDAYKQYLANKDNDDET